MGRTVSGEEPDFIQVRRPQEVESDAGDWCLPRLSLDHIISGVCVCVCVRARSCVYKVLILAESISILSIVNV